MENLLKGGSLLPVLNSPRFQNFLKKAALTKTLRGECASLKMKFRQDVEATLDGWALEGNFIDIIP